jgi:hypothetical protein
MRTRFKMWWRLVGSAVEHAAMLANPDREVDFQKLFLAREDDDEDSTSLAHTLAITAQQWPTTFDASEVARLINDQTDQRGTELREFLYPGARTFLSQRRNRSARLKSHLDKPVKSGNHTLILSKDRDTDAKQWRYFINRSAG